MTDVEYAPQRDGLHAFLLREPCDLEIIIPAFNEESRLATTLGEVRQQLREMPGLDARIVVVDNASSDRTSEVVDRLADDDHQLCVIGCSVPGKGAAVRRGIMTSSARFVGFLDADMAVPGSAIDEAVQRLESGADVVIASRRCEGASYEVRQPVSRRMGSWAFRMAIRSLVPDIADSQCGFKFFTRASAKDIFWDMDTSGFAFDVEVLLRALVAGYRVTELPVAWSDRADSTLRMSSHAQEIARDLVRLHRLSATLERDAERLNVVA